MTRRRTVLLGIDSVALSWLETFLRRGRMPAVQRLIGRGTLAPMRSFYPVDTGTNWACIATGASPMVTGCNMSMHLPGDPLDRMVSSFPAGYLRAEPLWLAAQRAGLTAAVFDWPHSAPWQEPERLLHVGEDGRPDNAVHALQEVRAYVTQLPVRLDPRARQNQPAHLLAVRPRPASADGQPAWRNLPETVRGSGPPVLGVELPIVPGVRSRYRHVDSLWALLWPGPGGYERVTLHAEPDAARWLATLRRGERSPWLRHTFQTDQSPMEAAFQAKLLRLAGDGTDLHLYLTEIYPTEDFAHPAALAADLLRVAGPFTAQPSRQQVVLSGASDVATYIEEQVAQGAWYERALRHVLGTSEWDLCMLKWHSTDWTNHLLAYATEPRHPLYDAAREAEAWGYWDQLFAQADRLVAAAEEAAGPEAVVALVSDHGSVAVPPGTAGYPQLNGLLEREGWLVRDAGGRIDWTRTRAYGHGHYLWLNVQGRDPDGIVAPGAAYDRERDRLIEAALRARDPATGAPLLRTAWPIEEAASLGVGGDRVGDVFILPWDAAAAVDERYRQAREQAKDGRFGTWDWPAVNSGDHTPDPFFIVAGPGVRAGYRRGQPAMLSSVAPTLCLAAGLPVPKDATGAPLWDALLPPE